MKVKIIAERGIEMGGARYRWGETLEVSEEVAARMVAAGVAEYAEGVPREAPAPVPLAEALDAIAAKPKAKPPVRKARVSVCNVPGCPELVAGTGKCPRHSAARRKATRHDRGYGRRSWRVARAKQLADFPYCQCEEHSVLPEIVRPLADVVDHLDSLGPLGPRGTDPANLRSMAKPCHDRKTRDGQFGGHGWGDRA